MTDGRKQRNIFRPNTIYKVDYSDQLRFGAIPKKILYKLYTDGRRTGLIIENDIEARFDNIIRTDREGADFDLVDSFNGFVYEVRVVTRGGVCFAPAKMIGAGRSIDTPGVLHKLSRIHYFILCDITTMPIVTIVAISTKNMYGNGTLKYRLTYSEFVKLIRFMSGDLPFPGWCNDYFIT